MEHQSSTKLLLCSSNNSSTMTKSLMPCSSLNGLHVYKDGTQLLTFLCSSVHLAYVPMCMLEKWTKSTGNGKYVHNFLEVRMCLKVRMHRDKSDNEST